MNFKSISKLAWKNFLFWLSRKIDYPLIPPDTIQVNFTFRCNLRCQMCNMYSHMKLLESKSERVEIDSDTFRKIIKESAEMKIKNIIFIGGEPFLREDLFDLVYYAKRLGLAVTVITNGVLLNRGTIEKCLYYQIDTLNISLDAFSQEIFTKVRGENVLNAIVENIKNLNSLKERGNLQLPRITATCTVMNDNLEELVDVISLCKELRIGSIAFQPAVINNVNQSIRDFCPPIFIPPSRLAILDEAMDKLINYKKKDSNFILNEIKFFTLMKKYFRREFSLKDVWPCYAGYNRLQITQDYVMYFCIPPHKQYKTSFGDVSKDRLKDLWYSKEAKIRRKLIKRCNVPCLQYCSYRFEFVRLSEDIKKAFRKSII